MDNITRKVLTTFKLYDLALKIKALIKNEEKKYQSFFSAFVSKGDLCFDIGANIGQRTKNFLRLGAKVVSVEPQPHCVEYLKKRFKNNRDVILVDKAVGAQNGAMEMFISDSHELSTLSKEWMNNVKSSGRFASSQWNHSITVPIITLDTLITQYGNPCFVKIDVEGYEYEVLRGLTKSVKLLSFEFTPELFSVAEKCIEHLGFISKLEINYCLAGNQSHFVLPQWITLKQFNEIKESICAPKLSGDIYVRMLA